MSRRIHIQEFDPSRPLVARKKFTANGRTFRPQDEFPWQRMAVARRRARQMFDAGFVRHETPGAAVKPSRGEIGPSGQGMAESTLEPFDSTEKQSEGTGEPMEPVESLSDIDGLDKLADLKAVAEAEGAPTGFRSKDRQREAIRAHRESK